MSGWITAIAIALAALIGAMAAGLAPRFLPAGKSGLWAAITAVAAGLLLASALVIVIPQGFEMVFQSHSPADTPRPEIFLGLLPGLAILAGFLLMLGLESGGMGHELQPGRNTLRIVAIGLGFHALTDGLALGASTATGLLTVTVPILVAVMVHKVPVAFALGAFLWRSGQAGNTPPLRTLVLFSLATPAGLLITFLFLRHLSRPWIGLMLLFSGGTFLYVAAVDVLGRVRREQQGMRLFGRVGLGVVLVIAALVLFRMFGLGAELHR